MSLKFGNNNRKNNSAPHNSTGYFHNPEEPTPDLHDGGRGDAYDDTDNASEKWEKDPYEDSARAASAASGSYFHGPEGGSSGSFRDFYRASSDSEPDNSGLHHSEYTGGGGEEDARTERNGGRREKQDESSHKARSQRKRRKGKAGLGGSGHRRGPAIVLAALALVAVGLGGFLALNVFTNYSGVTGGNTTDTEEQQVKAENGDYYIRPASDTIQYDKDVHLKYYDRMLVVYLEKELSDDEVDDLVSKVDGELTGKLSGIMNVLQIRIPDSGYDALTKAAKSLMEEKSVTYAHEDYPAEYEPTGISGEDTNPWSTDSGSSSFDEDNPSGNNWWAEAIGAYTAWKYVDAGYGSDYTLGMVDNGCDLWHPDLQSNIETETDNTLDDEYRSHGTHVAGIMSAENNTVGIRGIADRAKLLTADYSLNSDSVDVMSMNKQLIEAGCSVVNNSFGLTIKSKQTRTEYASDLNPFKEAYKFITYDFEVEEDYEQYIEEKIEDAARSGQTALNMIHQLLMAADRSDAPENIKEKRFLFVQAAGNGYDNAGVTGYNTKYKGGFGSVSLAREEYSSDKDFQKVLSETSYDEIRSHILIVGSVISTRNESGAYEIYSGTNYGKEVDIYAPGKDIYSTVTKDAGNYGNMSGTSMAAPMVAASAGLLWSLEPNLSVSEVTEYLLEYSNSVYGVINHATGVDFPIDEADDEDLTVHPMLNIGKAAEALMKNMGHTEKVNPGSGNLKKTFEEYLNNVLIPQNGLMSTDSWKLETDLNPFEQGDVSKLEGILSARIEDFDSDGYYEMLVVRYHYDSDGYAEMNLEMYELSNGKVTLKASMSFTDAGDICRDSFTWRTAVFVSNAVTYSNKTERKGTIASAEFDPYINVYAFETSGNDVETETVRIVKYENGSFRTKNLVSVSMHWDGGLRARRADNMTDDKEASLIYDADIRKDGKTKGSIVDSDDCGGTEFESSGDLYDKAKGDISAHELRGQILDKYYGFLAETGAEHKKIFPDRFSIMDNITYGTDGYKGISGEDYTVKDLFNNTEILWICELDNRYGADGENTIVPVDYTGLKRTKTTESSDTGTTENKTKETQNTGSEDKAADKNESTAEWVSAYAGILEKIDGQVMRKFTLVDIDGNSVPELVCMNGYSHADVSVAYECIDGTASEIEGAGSDSGIFICAPGTGKIAQSYFINSVGSFLEFYDYSAGKELSQIHAYDDTFSGSEEAKHIDGAVVDDSTYQERLKEEIAAYPYVQFQYLDLFQTSDSAINDFRSNPDKYYLEGTALSD